MFEEWSLQHKRIQDIIKRTTLLRRNVAGMSKSALEIKALFLAANPKTTPQLAVDEEMRAIEQKLRASEYRDTLVFRSAWAVQPDDLLQLLNQHRPHIVHFGVPTFLPPVFPAKDSSRRFCFVFSPLSLEKMGFLSHPRWFY